MGPERRTRTLWFQVFRWAAALSSALFYDCLGYYLIATHFSLPVYHLYFDTSLHGAQVFSESSLLPSAQLSNRTLQRRALTLPLRLLSLNSGQTAEADFSRGETSALLMAAVRCCFPYTNGSSMQTANRPLQFLVQDLLLEWGCFFLFSIITWPAARYDIVTGTLNRVLGYTPARTVGNKTTPSVAQQPPTFHRRV